MFDSLFELHSDQQLEITVAIEGSVVRPADARAIGAKDVVAGFGPVAERSEFVKAISQLAGRR
jgi:hypothetical protein